MRIGPSQCDQGLLEDDFFTVQIAHLCLHFYHFTVDRIHALLMCLSDLKEKHLQERTPVSHVVTYALAVLLSAFGSKQLAVHIKAKFIIDSLSTENLQVCASCFRH